MIHNDSKLISAFIVIIGVFSLVAHFPHSKIYILAALILFTMILFVRYFHFETHEHAHHHRHHFHHHRNKK